MEKDTKIEEREAENADHGHREQGQIEGHGGDGTAKPTRDIEINLPNVKK